MLLLDKISPAAPTKEMQVLLDLLRNGGIDKTNTKTLYTTMAPVITAAMQLDITESGKLCCAGWITIIPQGYSPPVRPEAYYQKGRRPATRKIGGMVSGTGTACIGHSHLYTQ